MSTETVVLPDGRTATLTTEHPSSSYGQPVLVVEDVPHGPADYRCLLDGDGELLRKWNDSQDK